MLLPALLYVFGAVALIWLGIGSRLGRRWVRPLMVAISAVIAVTGFVSIVPLIIGIFTVRHSPPTVITATTVSTTGGTTTVFSPGATSYSVTTTTTTVSATPGVALSSGFQSLSLASGGCGVFLFMGVLPSVLLWFYGRPSVKATLEQMDPRPRWTDNCPLPVIIWSVACLQLAFGLLSVAVLAVFPFFNSVLIGTFADVVALSLAALFIVGAILCFKLSKVGWLMTFVATLFLAGSYITFSIVGDQQLYIDQIFEGYHLPGSSLTFAGQMSRAGWISPAITYSLAIGYILWLWTRFEQPVTSASSPEQP
jgi:hypothetical protein